MTDDSRLAIGTGRTWGEVFFAVYVSVSLGWIVAMMVIV